MSEVSTPSGWKKFTTRDGVVYFYNEKTGESTYDTPAEWRGSSSAALIESGSSSVWIPDKDQAFISGTVTRQLFGGKVEVQLENGTTVQIDGTKLVSFNSNSIKEDVDDLVLLEDLSEATVFYKIKQRFIDRKIYTNIGNILISVNPYQALDLYTPAQIQRYRTRGSSELPPHVYIIADDAYQLLRETGGAQSIIISGESGAGKTEATKQCLQYLADFDGSFSNIEQRILESNPILEAFGNAKTVRNNNSSRFGKFIQIFFDYNLQIVGARITKYLLEKVRVSYQNPLERSYHIFFQLCAGLPRSLKSEFQISDPSKYNYLKNVDKYTVPGINDEEDFQSVRSSMDHLGFDEKEIYEVFQTVSAILHVGNIGFYDIGDKKCAMDNLDEVEIACRMLGVSYHQMEQALTSKKFQSGRKASGETIITVSAKQAGETRDAMAKFIYDRLFDFLVRKINEALYVESQGATRIGILDIFGFEIFGKNSFEQLCINFTNEKLQQQFNTNTFRREEELYRAEQVKFSSITYKDNQPVLDLIEQRPKGVLPTLDEVQLFPKSSDELFASRLIEIHEKNPFFARNVKDPKNFKIKHYAGEVEYDATGFLEKNKDTISDDLVTLLQQTNSVFLRRILFDDAVEQSRRKSLGFQFMAQLNDLMSDLNATEPHYIRCIKPNKNKSPTEFDGPMVLEQLTYSGVFEAIQIRKSGYPFRYRHLDFCKKYRAINPLLNLSSPKAAALEYIKIMGLLSSGIQIGKTRVLYKVEDHKALEVKRYLALDKLAVKIQKIWRGYAARKKIIEWRKYRNLIDATSTSRDIDEINRVLDQVSHITLPLRNLEKLRKQKRKLERQDIVLRELQDLSLKDCEQNLKAYEKVVQDAEEIELENELTCLFRERIDQAKKRIQCRSILQPAILARNEKQLRAGLELAEKLDYVDNVVKEALILFDRIQNERLLIARIYTTCTRGGYVNEGDGIDLDVLPPLINEAKEFGLQTKAGLAGLELIEALQELRIVLAPALDILDKSLWKPVEVCIFQNQNKFGKHPEFAAAKVLLSYVYEAEEIVEKLNTAIAKFDDEEIQVVLEAAFNFGMIPENYPVLIDAQQTLTKIRDVQGRLQEALANVDIRQIANAIKYADSFGYQKSDVIKARETLAELVRIFQEAEKGLSSQSIPEIRDIIAAAEAVGLKLPFLDKLLERIEDLQDDTYLDKIIKAAIQSGNVKQINEALLKKDKFFIKNGNKYDFKRYPLLLSPDDWARAKRFRQSTLAGTFFVHTTVPIHAGLLKGLSAKSILDAQVIFKNILAFMGDVSNTSLPYILAKDILFRGFKDRSLIPEMYCQLVKQLTDNPKELSRTKGFKLMLVFLDTFPPGSGLEPYLEVWLAKNAPVRTAYLRLLYQSMYGAPRRTLPSDAEIKQIIQDGVIFKDTLSPLDMRLEAGSIARGTQDEEKSALTSTGEQMIASPGSTIPPPMVGRGAPTRIASPLPAPTTQGSLPGLASAPLRSPTDSSISLARGSSQFAPLSSAGSLPPPPPPPRPSTTLPIPGAPPESDLASSSRFASSPGPVPPLSSARTYPSSVFPPGPFAPGLAYSSVGFAPGPTAGRPAPVAPESTPTSFPGGAFRSLPFIPAGYVPAPFGVPPYGPVFNAPGFPGWTQGFPGGGWVQSFDQTGRPIWFNSVTREIRYI